MSNKLTEKDMHSHNAQLPSPIQQSGKQINKQLLRLLLARTDIRWSTNETLTCEQSLIDTDI